MFILRNKPLEHILIPKPFTIPEEEDFITKLSIQLPEQSSYLSDEATFWDSLDEKGYQNLQNALER